MSAKRIRTDKKSMILGRALEQGLTKLKFQKLTGMSPATFDRRMKNPDTITIGELRQMDAVAHFKEEMLLDLIRRT